ncbi:hypothetical protein Tsubulata_002184 [Turnera subulata]|uniref:TFIIS N-terminal domain-containing protein n=1 Tax=Turnera subulata TaxID=218843 RepID=A0A9Q0JBI8_9ROSI|nr:hypothetical protein Tsubulata_002184 [Turnera subulata]
MEVISVEEVAKLLRVARKAKGYSTSEEELSRCVDALSRLNSLPVTAHTLVAAKSGTLLAPLRRHPHKKIRDLARLLFKNWGEILYKSLGKRDKTATPASALKVPDDARRSNVRLKIYQALCKAYAETHEDYCKNHPQVKACLDNRSSDAVGISVSVESVLFKNWGRDNLTKYRSFLFNINDPRNPDFRRKVLLGQVEPERIVGMSPKEMASDELQAQYQGFEHLREKRRFIKTASAGMMDATPTVSCMC